MMASECAGYFMEKRFSGDDLRVLSKVFSDEKGKELLKNVIEDVCDSEHVKLYEKELKEYEKEQGSDIEFVTPKPGFAFELNAVDSKDPVFINICQSDYAKPPRCQEETRDEKNGLNWQWPYILPKPRHECIQTPKLSKLKRCLVYDIIYHPRTLELAKSDERIKDAIATTSLLALRESYDVELPAKQLKFMGWDKYIGFPLKSILRRPVEEEESKNGSITPEFKLKYVNKLDMQHFCILNTPNTKPQILALEIQLPGVKSASELDVETFKDKLCLASKSSPQYALDLPFPCVVQEASSKASFNVETQVLMINVDVEAASPPYSPGGDSGIECDFRTTSETSGGGANNEVKGSEEVVCESSGDRTNCDIDISESSSEEKSECLGLVPGFDLAQTDTRVFLEIHSSILENTLNVNQYGRSILICFTSVGGGYTRLCYSFKVTFDGEVTFDQEADLEVNPSGLKLECQKAVPGLWVTCQVGTPGKMEEVRIKVVKPLQNEDPTKKEEVQLELRPHVERSPRQRTLSECSVPGSAHRRKSFMGSWPHGILKPRNRSYSESNIGDICSLSFSLDLEDTVEDDDSSPTESENTAKKSVRFSDVVSKQLFRANSSILGQRAKNRKRAMQKRKALAKAPIITNENAKKGKGAPYDRESFLKDNSKVTKENGEVGKRSRRGKRNRPAKEIELCNNLIFELDI